MGQGMYLVPFVINLIIADEERFWIDRPFRPDVRYPCKCWGAMFRLEGL